MRRQTLGERRQHAAHDERPVVHGEDRVLGLHLLDRRAERDHVAREDLALSSESDASKPAIGEPGMPVEIVLKSCLGRVAEGEAAVLEAARRAVELGRALAVAGLAVAARAVLEEELRAREAESCAWACTGANEERAWIASRTGVDALIVQAPEAGPSRVRPAVSGEQGTRYNPRGGCFLALPQVRSRLRCSPALALVAVHRWIERGQYRRPRPWRARGRRRRSGRSPWSARKESERPGTSGSCSVTIDTLRADHVSCYGYPRETTPFLDSLAARRALHARHGRLQLHRAEPRDDADRARAGGARRGAERREADSSACDLADISAPPATRAPPS